MKRSVWLGILVTLTSFLRIIAQADPLAVALDATNLTWTTGGTFGGQWSPTTQTSHDGISCAMSGSVGSGTSYIQTTVQGPGTLSFWWRCPSMYNTLTFTVGGTTVAAINWYSTWQQQVIYIGSGSQTLKWTYARTEFPGDAQSAYVDQVTYTAGATAPIIDVAPLSQSQVPGLNCIFSVKASGTPPLAYQWQFGGTNLIGATASSFTVTNVQGPALGAYRVVVTNSVGTNISADAQLDFGQLTAWGSAYAGACSVPIGATNLSMISGGWNFSLALKQDGTVLAWGDNSVGEANVPADLVAPNAVAAGLYFGVALTSNGLVRAWGWNDVGQTNVPAGLSNVVAISAGGVNALALTANGNVSAWGGWYSGVTNVPVGLSNGVAISCLEGFAIALRADGTVAKWGGDSGIPGDITNVVAIAAGAGHSVALFADGSIRAWGQNVYGEINVPPTATNIVAIASGNFHSLALRRDGVVIAWGLNNVGQTNVPAGLSNVVMIAAGENHSLAVVGNAPPSITVPISKSALSAGVFQLSVPSKSGRVYALEYKNTLNDTAWNSSPLVAGNGRELVLTDNAPTNSMRFYRVRVW